MAGRTQLNRSEEQVSHNLPMQRQLEQASKFSILSTLGKNTQNANTQTHNDSSRATICTPAIVNTRQEPADAVPPGTHQIQGPTGLTQVQSGRPSSKPEDGTKPNIAGAPGTRTETLQQIERNQDPKETGHTEPETPRSSSNSMLNSLTTRVANP